MTQHVSNEALQSIPVEKWAEYVASLHGQNEPIRAVLSEFHGSGADMAAEIIRLRAVVDMAAEFTDTLGIGIFHGYNEALAERLAEMIKELRDLKKQEAS